MYYFPFAGINVFNSDFQKRDTESMVPRGPCISVVVFFCKESQTQYNSSYVFQMKKNEQSNFGDSNNYNAIRTIYLVLIISASCISFQILNSPLKFGIP